MLGWGGRLPLGFKSGELTATIKKGKLVFKEDKFYNHVTREYGNIIPKFRFRKPFVSMKQHCAILKLQRNYYRAEMRKYLGNNIKAYRNNRNMYVRIIRELYKDCITRPYKSYQVQLEREKKRLQNLIQQIQTKVIAKAQTRRQTEEYIKEANLLVGQIYDLNIKIKKEKEKKCPKPATCTVTPPKYGGKDMDKNTPCTEDMLRDMLKKRGFTKSQISQLDNALKYQPSINDFDIREHKDYSQYINRKNIISCDRVSATPEAIERLRELKRKKLLEAIRASGSNVNPEQLMQVLQDTNQANQAQIQALLSIYEKRALAILKEALLRYHMAIVPSELDTTSNMRQLQAEITDKLNSTQINHDAINLRRIQQILNAVMNSERYQTLRGKIIQTQQEREDLLKEIQRGKGDIAALKQRLMTIRQLLAQHSKEIENFIVQEVNKK